MSMEMRVFFAGPLSPAAAINDAMQQLGLSFAITDTAVDFSLGGFMPMAGSLRVVLGLSGAFVTFYVLFGGPVASYAETAARSFF